MTLALHFDPYAGLSAASALGALLDAGLSLDALRAELAKLGLSGWTLTAERVTAGVTGTRATFIIAGAHRPLTLGEARATLAASTALDAEVRARSLRALTHLATAAGWGTARDSDPVGTLDTVLALIGVVAGLALLHVTDVTTAAPPRGIAGSPVTPAADALLATLATVRPPALRLRQVGYGLGPPDPAGPHPVAVRVWLGEPEPNGAVAWQTLVAPALANDAVPGALVLVVNHAEEAGPDYERLAALAAAWAGIPARLAAFAGAREGIGPARLTAAIEDCALAGARRIVLQRLGLGADPALEDGLVGIIRWARGRWPDTRIVPALPLLTGRQLAYRLAGRAVEAVEATGVPSDPADTALLLLAPSSADAEANADAYRLARLVWEGRDWLTVEVAFAAGATPSLGSGLTRCRRLGARRVIVLPTLALAGAGYARMAAVLDAARAAHPDLTLLLGRPPGTAEGFAAIAWERYREASGLPIGDAAHGSAGGSALGHNHGTNGGHGGLSALRPILPPRYQGGAVVSSAPMGGAADLAHDADGQVDWDSMWGDFCDLAIAGGPPHRGELLVPPLREDVLARPDEQAKVLDELTRGLRQITGWPLIRDAAPGWIGLVCPDADAAVWLLRAVLTENVAARREGVTLFLPAGPDFQLGKEIKNIVTVVAKTHHYWTEHGTALGDDSAPPRPAHLSSPTPPTADPALIAGHASLVTRPSPPPTPPGVGPDPVAAHPAIVGTDPTATQPGRRRYDYHCSDCATRFDLERAVADAGSPAACPVCGAPARRVFTAPRLLFKADPRDTRPAWHNHGGYGHAHAPGKGTHGTARKDERG